MKPLKTIWNLVLTLAAFAIVGVLVCDWMVSRGADGRIYNNVDSVPERQYGVVLGTSPVSDVTHRRNLSFERRVMAARDLYMAHKVDMLIVSGGDYTDQGGYDEPKAMRDTLLQMGVKSDDIVMDYDGERTIQSVANVRDKYDADSVTIISQAYHCERALYQAEHLGVDAIGYAAETPYGRTSMAGLRNGAREYVARVRMFIDLMTDNQ